MSKLMDQAVEAMRALPASTQDDLARFLLALTREPAVLSSDERSAIAEAEAEIARGERVSPQVMQAFWQAHDL